MWRKVTRAVHRSHFRCTDRLLIWSGSSAFERCCLKFNERSGKVLGFVVSSEVTGTVYVLVGHFQSRDAGKAVNIAQHSNWFFEKCDHEKFKWQEEEIKASPQNNQFISYIWVGHGTGWPWKWTFRVINSCNRIGNRDWNSINFM